MLSRCCAFLSHLTTKIWTGCSPSFCCRASLAFQMQTTKTMLLCFYPFSQQTITKQLLSISAMLCIFPFLLSATLLCLLLNLFYTAASSPLHSCAISLHCSSRTILCCVYSSTLMCLCSCFFSAAPFLFSQAHNYIQVLLLYITERLTLLPLFFYVAASFIKTTHEKSCLKLLWQGWKLIQSMEQQTNKSNSWDFWMLRYIPHVRNKTWYLLFLPILPTRINTSVTSLKLVVKQKAFTSRKINLLRACTFNQIAAHPYRTTLSAPGKTALPKLLSMCLLF